MMTQLRDRLDEVIRAGQVGGLHAVAAVRGGQTVLEYYGAGEDFAWGVSLGEVKFGQETLHDIRSVTKSVTAGVLRRNARASGDELPASPGPGLDAEPGRTG